MSALLLEDGSRLLLEDGSRLLLEAYDSTSSTRPLVWLYTLTGQRLLPLHDLGDLIVEDRLGDLETLTFTIRADDPKAFAVVADQLVEYNDRFYRVQQLHQSHTGARTMIEAYCEALWLDLAQRGPGGTFSALGQTAVAGLGLILDGSGWTAAVTPDDIGLYSMEDIDSTVLALVRQWAGIVGREIAWDTANHTVTLVASLGSNGGIGFRFGHNLRSVDRRFSPPVATRLYPFGANDLEVTNVNPAATNYVEDYSWYTTQGLTVDEARASFRKDQVWSDERYLVALNLFDAAVRRLAVLAQPTISYELAVADFAALTASAGDDVSIGDTVRVTDAAFAIDLSTRVVRLVTHPLLPQANVVELSYLQPGLGGPSSITTGSPRTIDYSKLSMFVDANIAAVVVGAVITPFANVQITSTGESTVILGATCKATATGAGTVRFSVSIDGVDLVPTYDFAFVDGAQVEFSWPTFATGVDTSATALISWRARVITGTGTLNVAVGEGRGWLLVAGAVGAGVSTNPSQDIEETLALVTGMLFDTADVAMFTVVDTVTADTVTYTVTVVTDTADVTFI